MAKTQYPDFTDLIEAAASADCSFMSNISSIDIQHGIQGPNTPLIDESQYLLDDSRCLIDNVMNAAAMAATTKPMETVNRGDGRLYLDYMGPPLSDAAFTKPLQPNPGPTEIDSSDEEPTTCGNLNPIKEATPPKMQSPSQGMRQKGDTTPKGVVRAEGGPKTGSDLQKKRKSEYKLGRGEKTMAKKPGVNKTKVAAGGKNYAGIADVIDIGESEEECSDNGGAAVGVKKPRSATAGRPSAPDKPIASPARSPTAAPPKNTARRRHRSPSSSASPPPARCADRGRTMTPKSSPTSVTSAGWYRSPARSPQTGVVERSGPPSTSPRSAPRGRSPPALPIVSCCSPAASPRRSVDRGRSRSSSSSSTSSSSSSSDGSSVSRGPSPDRPPTPKRPPPSFIPSAPKKRRPAMQRKKDNAEQRSPKTDLSKLFSQQLTHPPTSNTAASKATGTAKRKGKQPVRRAVQQEETEQQPQTMEQPTMLANSPRESTQYQHPSSDDTIDLVSCEPPPAANNAFYQRPRRGRGRRPSAMKRVSSSSAGAESCMSIGVPEMPTMNGPLLMTNGDPWPGSEPPPPGKVRYGGTGDYRQGLWDEPEIRYARERYAESRGPVAVFVGEMGDSSKQYDALVKALYSNSFDAMGWIQCNKITGEDLLLEQVCQKQCNLRGGTGSGSFITGSVARPLPHIGDAMAAGNALWGLPHVAAAVAMSRRYDKVQKQFLQMSLRRAYAYMLFPAKAVDASASLTDDISSIYRRMNAVRRSMREATEGLQTVTVRGDSQIEPQNTPQSTDHLATEQSAADPDFCDPEHASDYSTEELADACVLACNAVIEVLLECFGGAGNIPGISSLELDAACPSAQLHRHHVQLLSWIKDLKLLPICINAMRLRGELSSSQGIESCVMALRAVGTVISTVRPFVNFSVDRARRRYSAWNLTEALFSAPSGNGSAKINGAKLSWVLSHLTPKDKQTSPLVWPIASKTIDKYMTSGSGIQQDGGSKRKDQTRSVACQTNCHKQDRERKIDGANRVNKQCQQIPGSERANGKGEQPRRFASKRKSMPVQALPRDGIDNGADDVHGPPQSKRHSVPSNGSGAYAQTDDTAPKDRDRPDGLPKHQNIQNSKKDNQTELPWTLPSVKALGPMPQGGPHPRGGYRRVPTGITHTPLPTESARSTYCQPDIVAELLDDPMFPPNWKPALMFDPEALARVAARRGGSHVEGRLYGPLRVTDPLRKQCAWMNQIPDPEDVKVVIMYCPLVGEELSAAPVASCMPMWSDEKGGLSFLLAALCDRLCSYGSHAWAGNWTGVPDISALNSRGVLLLSVRDLGFAGAVEYLCLRLGSAHKRLIFLDTIDTVDWPADGPAISSYHSYIKATITPQAHGAHRWPDCEAMSRVVMTSRGIVGPGVFARVEAAFAQLYPNEPPLQLMRGDNVKYVVETKAGRTTRVPMTPREYRGLVLPQYDRKDMAFQADGLSISGPDFLEGAAYNHRAANRWGLGAPLRPLYLTESRKHPFETPDDIPEVVRSYCAAALLEPQMEGNVCVVNPNTIQRGQRPPTITWELCHGGSRATSIEAGDMKQAIIPPNEQSNEDDVTITAVQPSITPMPKAPHKIKIEILSDGDDSGDEGNPYAGACRDFF